MGSGKIGEWLNRGLWRVDRGRVDRGWVDCEWVVSCGGSKVDCGWEGCGECGCVDCVGGL